MRNGIIYKSDGEKLIEIYRLFNVDGSLKRELSAEEMVLIYAMGNVLKEKAIEDAMDINVPGKWIPCSEKLPDSMSNDKPNDVLVCVRVTETHVGCNKKQAIYYGWSAGCYYDEKWWITYVYGCKRISEINEEYKNCHYEVIAWMPLPEPYKENNDERS